MTDKTEFKAEDLAPGTILWLGRDEQSYYDLLAQEVKANDLDLSAEELKELAYIDRDDDEFQGYGHMINLMDNGIAVINISGPMKNKETLWSRIFGTPTYEGLSNAMIAAAMHNDSRGILLDWDSPGGDVKGISLPSDTITSLRKAGMPVWSYTGGDMMSAAVWIGTHAEKVNASKDAEIGSIGVVAIHRDLSKMFEQMGVKHTIRRAGKEKALVNPYEPLSKEAIKYIDDRLERNYTKFIDTVAANRGQTPAYIRANAAEGQEFEAEEAKAVHLVDKVVSFDATIDAFAKRLDRKKDEPQQKSYFGALPMADKDKIDPNASAAALVGAGLSTEAAAAALAEKGVKPEDEETTDATDTSASNTGGDGDTLDQSASATGDGTDAKPGEDATGDAEGGDKPKADGGETSVLAGLLSDAQKENRELAVKVSDLERAAKENETALTAYRGLVVESVKGMRIGLGRPGDVSDLDDASHLTVVGAYKSTHGEVVAAFPTQQASKQATDEGTKLSDASLQGTLNKVTSLTRSRG